jgi:hypothetical protein
MRSIVIICLVASVMGTTLTGENYNGIKSIVDGFMKGYLGEDHELSEKCMDSESQSKIDGDFIAIFTTLIGGNFEKTMAQIEIFGDDLSSMYEVCGITEVGADIREYFDDEGALNIILNLFYRFFDITAGLLDVLENLVIGNFEGAGNRLGQVTALIAPVKTN